ELRNLQGCTMNEDDLDAQRAQHRQIEQNVREIGRSHDLAVDRHHENALPEARDILEDTTEVGNFHQSEGGQNDNSAREQSENTAEKKPARPWTHLRYTS